jgi:predicted oxidoreductase
MFEGFSFAPVWDALMVGIAGIVTAIITGLTTMFSSRYKKRDRQKKIDNAVEEGVRAVEQRSAYLEIKGEEKFLKSLEYTKCLLNDEGVSTPADIVLEAKIHAYLSKIKNNKEKEVNANGNV